MYIKRVTKKNKGSRKRYSYLQLVENIRTEKGPRQRLILNLGDLNVKPEKYKELANCIESMLTGQAVLFSQDTAISSFASEAVKKISNKHACTRTQQPEDDKQLLSDTADVRPVDVNSIDTTSIRSIGPEYLCHKAWQSLKIDACLTELGVSPNVLPLLEALVVGRAVSPGSELHTKAWADNNSAVYELCGTPLRHSLNSYYRGSDLLFECKESLESHLGSHERDLFSLKERICFFDLTNTHFEGEMKKNTKARFGRSKQKRSDCRLVTLALIIDEDGFIKHSKLYPGNQYEAHTLEAMLQELEKSRLHHPDKPTIVMDAGIASKDNIAYLKERGFHYIVVNRGKSPFTDSDLIDMTALKKKDSGEEHSVSVKRINDDQNDEVYILCKSEKREKKEQAISTRQHDLFIEQLTITKAGLQKKGRLKLYAKIVEKVGRLREKYPKASKKYTVDVLTENQSDKDISKLLATDIIWSEKESPSNDAQNSNGCYVLRSDRVDLSDDEIWNIYVMLTNIERAFRDMKSSLGLRPNFHQLEKRADAHMFISVLAYHLIHTIEYQLRKKGDNRNWVTLREVLSTHCRLTVEYTEYADSKIKGRSFIRLCSRPEAQHVEIYKKLKLPMVPLEKKYFENM